MKIPWMTVVNFLLFILTTILFAGFQNTFWFQLFGSVPAPMLWLCVVVYVSIYRKLYPALFQLYIIGIALGAFTAMPLKMMFVSVLLVYLILYTIRSRVFWDGPGYYTLMCVVAVVSYHIIYLIASAAFERNSVSYDVVDRLLQIVITPAFSFPVFWLLNKIDRWTLDDLSLDSGGMRL